MGAVRGAGQNVTALAPVDNGLFIATRDGVWYQKDNGRLEKLNLRAAFLDTECQALYAMENGLWIGTRTGLFFLADASISR